ncbi:ammonia-forming cytochrome c nitrite reductase subunit c552 [Kamptonema cortianum]|nr:ammonia-forming cytochrome c nitrite reductase subunit c552 [Oscillatoria laete-virens]MDK3157361.1 ammonia-forming cytochrome c nitrite reductase subunit c552 [Kamptonema cortianum]MDL5054885.1 ammonia-forming cytochrome c nitrite reductase subunit c552 [Oscillatoria laete-virens NRMC-F 0139]
MKRFFTRAALLYGVVFIGAVVLTAGIAALLINITERQREAQQYPLMLVEIGDNEIDPEVWGRNFPVHYDRFMMTRLDYGETPYGGSTPYSKLERYPAMVRLWAGYAFSIDHNEERGHYYAQIDQRETERVQVVNQPGACINCHAAEAPLLIADMGWETFNRTPYNDLADQLHFGSSCADCHDPQTMALRITRPALVEGLALRGIDITQATRQEMRTYVCAQCHVEYYFLGEDRILTFPWSQGFTIDDIEAHYDSYGFRDWVHAETGAPMIKIQHPEFEMWTTSLHARSNVSCADCHMPYIREGGIKITDHWIRSPLVNLNNACQTCHNIPESELEARITTIQSTTADLLRDTEEALLEAIDAIVAAREAGATDEEMAEAWQFHRAASLRWDFVSSENSTGFHSPQESARILADAINYARQAQLSAVQVLNRLQAGGAVAALPEADVPLTGDS